MAQQTRSVFAVILDEMRRSIVLVQEVDSSGWRLPGGVQEAGETDEETLKRTGLDELGLHLEVLDQFGPEHLAGNDTAVAYLCKVKDVAIGFAAPRTHRYCNKQEILQSFYVMRHTQWSDDGIGMTRPRVNIPLKLLGPEGRLGRMGRMVWDGLSILDDPLTDQAPFTRHEFLGQDDLERDILVCMGIHFFKRERRGREGQGHDEWFCWPRLDPYAPDGRMVTRR